MRLLKILIAFSRAFIFISSSGFARDITYIDSVLNPAKLQGSGRLNWWGFHVYDATFYRADTLSSAEFALDIRYQ